jgi:SAM-dependent methyltransferase
MTALPEQRARNADFWAQAAQGWIQQADRHDRLGHPLGAAALDALELKPGERVLDVGCGCGGTTAELAAMVTPGGSAAGLDFCAPMVAAAAQRFPHLVFTTADIETAAPGSIAGSPFDAVFSRMTLMLLADPVAGCVTIRRLLRPGGRLAATVFRDGAANPWLAAAVLGAAPHVGALPPLPVGAEPGPFAFAEAAHVMRVLTDAGLTGITVESRDVELRAPDEPDAVADWLIDIGPAGAAYRAAPASRQEAARAGAARLLRRHHQPGAGYRLPTGLWLITASTPL